MALLKLASISIFCLNILILCFQVNPAFPDLPIHGQKNSTLLKQILNTKSGEEVLECEVVQLHILPKKGAEDQNVIRVHLSAFGKDILLRLERNDDFNRWKEVKFTKGSLTDNGVQLTEVNVENDDPGIPYIDLAEMAAVTIHYGADGELLMDGVIGDNLLIKPVLSDEYPGGYIICDWGFSDDESKYSTSAPIKDAHIVYKNPMKLSYEEVLEDVPKSVDSSENGADHKRHLHAFPEVLLMVDYDSYAMHVSHGFNDAQIKRYYVSFFNGVDLKFKIISDPKISLVLSQIVVFKSRDDTPFLKNNLMFRNRTVFIGEAAINDLARHMYSYGKNYSDVDVAILLTKLDMCSISLIGCRADTLGLAPFGGACNINHLTKRWMGVAIVEDAGGFDGILTATHEIGHLLGSHHDGTQLKMLPDHFYNCSDEDGYIMTTKFTSNRILQWSECSIKQFRLFLSSHRASCLFNQPRYRNELEGSELPGVVLSLDEQCKRILGTRANAWDSRVCDTLHCDIPTEQVISKKKTVLPPAAEGSSCGVHLHCRNGKCVSKYLNDSQTWSTTPVHDTWEYIDSTTVSTTTKLPTTTELPSTEACVEEKEDKFCKLYFQTIGHDACRSARILENCCFSHKIRCEV